MFGDFDRFLMRIESKLNDMRYDFLLKPIKSQDFGVAVGDAARLRRAWYAEGRGHSD